MKAFRAIFAVIFAVQWILFVAAQTLLYTVTDTSASGPAASLLLVLNLVFSLSIPVNFTYAVMVLTKQIAAEWQALALIAGAALPYILSVTVLKG